MSLKTIYVLSGVFTLLAMFLIITSGELKEQPVVYFSESMQECILVVDSDTKEEHSSFDCEALPTEYIKIIVE